MISWLWNTILLLLGKKMALQEQDFTIEKGSTFILEFQLTKDDGTALELAKLNAYNQYGIGNYSFRTKFRKTKYKSGNPAYSLSTVDVLQIDDEQLGRTADGFYVIASKPGFVRFTMSPASTASIKHGKYFYDIEVVEGVTGNYQITKALAGRISIEEEVTK